MSDSSPARIARQLVGTAMGVQLAGPIGALCGAALGDLLDPVIQRAIDKAVGSGNSPFPQVAEKYAYSRILDLLARGAPGTDDEWARKVVRQTLGMCIGSATIPPLPWETCRDLFLTFAATRSGEPETHEAARIELTCGLLQRLDFQCRGRKPDELRQFVKTTFEPNVGFCVHQFRPNWDNWQAVQAALMELPGFEQAVPQQEERPVGNATRIRADDPFSLISRPPPPTAGQQADSLMYDLDSGSQPDEDEEEQEEDAWLVFQAGRAGGETARSSRVHFLVSAKSEVRPGEAFRVRLFAHMENQRARLLERIREEARSGEATVASKGPVRVADGTELLARLEIDGLEVKSPAGTLLWEGEVANHDFPVRVPVDAGTGERAGSIQISVHGIPLCELHFVICVGTVSAEEDLLTANGRRFRQGFASYASQDRGKVIGRVQGIEAAADIEVWMDVVHLRAGANWQKAIERRIGISDVFYLFWSQFAAASDWVRKETELARSLKGDDFIRPVPLETVLQVDPPEWFPSRHWNDVRLYVEFAEQEERRRHTLM